MILWVVVLAASVEEFLVVDVVVAGAVAPSGKQGTPGFAGSRRTGLSTGSVIEQGHDPTGVTEPGAEEEHELGDQPRRDNGVLGELEVAQVGCVDLDRRRADERGQVIFGETELEEFSFGGVRLGQKNIEASLNFVKIFLGPAHMPHTCPVAIEGVSALDDLVGTGRAG